MHLATIPIIFYQRYVSPYKGYRCAYAVLRNSQSCSEFGRLAIERLGLLPGLKLLGRRLKKCRAEYKLALAGEREEEMRRRRIQVRRKKKSGDTLDYLDCCNIPCGGFEPIDAGQCDFDLGICDCVFPSF